MVHRGPDDEAIYCAGEVGLGNRRLSIIDIPGGRQPISNEDQTVWVVYNGEIYNHPHLRKKLVEQGHRFYTHTDTEVIVHLYEEMGEKFVEQLNGMFAIALWDQEQGKLVLVRDRIGQKPLFYSRDGQRLVFASEIKAILAANSLNREMDAEAVHHYLSLRFIPPPRTMLCNIEKLPPAHMLVHQNGQARISRYWNLSLLAKLDLAEDEYLEGLEARLIQTIDAHLISDVPVGAYLSGGLDSSMITAVMAKDLGRSFKTFAIGVKEQDFDEIPFARLVAEQYHTEHIEQRVEARLIHSLPQIIWHLDEPSDPIASCVFQAAALASKHVKVVLGGDGGDELFAGFDRYAGLSYVNTYALLPDFLRRKLIGPVLSRIPDNFGYKNRTQKLRWIQQLSLLNGDAVRYAEATLFSRFNREGKQVLYQDRGWAALGELNSADFITGPFTHAPAEDPIDRMLYTDFVTRLPEHSLMLTDRMTMAHGLEARSPFLDHELVEYLAAFPSRLKIRGLRTKVILRKLARNYLPEQIVQRQKQGFMFPIASWFREELYLLLSQTLLNSFFVREGLFSKEAVQSLLDEHRTRRFDHHVRLWMLLNLEIWHQLYIEEAGIETVITQLHAVLSS